MKLLHIPKTGGTSLLVSGIPGGHHITYKPGEKYITIIRDPVDWTLSYFQEQTERKNIRLDQWLKEEFCNFQTKWLAKKILGKSKVNRKVLNEVIDILKKDFKVLVTSKLQDFTKVHVNKARKKYSLLEGEKEMILERNNLDRKLYKWAITKE